MNAIELLTAFSGESETQYEEFFRFSEEARIVGVEIHAVGTESTTADGSEGISGVDSQFEGEFSEEHLLELQGVAADLLALQSLDPVEVGTMLEESRPDLSDASRSSIDIALWDLAARKAGRPLYKLLGGKRDSIETYASLPFYDSLPEYVDAVNAYAKLGYTTFKFHVWGQVEDDSRLVELVTGRIDCIRHLV